MPVTKSAKKALRVSLKNRERNLVFQKNMKIAIKKARSDASSLALAIKAIDKAAQRGVITKRNAARRKSRLSRSKKEEKA